MMGKTHLPNLYSENYIKDAKIKLSSYLLASRALISSIKPLPPSGSGPFPRPVSVLGEAELAPPLVLGESSF